MKLLRACVLVLSALASSITAASSHHSFAAVYDADRVITVEGVVTQFRFVNPHAMMVMEVTDANGQASQWTVESSGRLNLSQLGWTADSIKPGERITVTGNPTHTGSLGIFFRRLVLADGTELLPRRAQRLKAIEEERRQRALQRNRQQ